MARFNVSSSYTGSHEVERVAFEFVSLVGQEKVLFPGAADGRRNIQKKLPTNQVIDLPIYETKTINILLSDNYDVVVFTSPSNVLGYFNSGNKININQKAIAIGRSTKQELDNQGVDSILPWSYKELAWADAVNGISI